ncbi:MAG: universal stress protein [Halobacteria archaeon]|nr:universal stress protein [Halobacteria archaeon]
MKILLGIGGSEDSVRALRRTAERTEETGDDLTVAVVDNPRSDSDADDVKEKVRGILDEYDVSSEVRRVEGHAGSRIVDIAEREGFDEIVLGGGEKSPMGKIRIGHIAEFVILNSNISVKLVR